MEFPQPGLFFESFFYNGIKQLKQYWKPKKSIIKDIAEKLNCGMHSNYHIKTHQIIAIPNVSDLFDEEEFQESFGSEFEKNEKKSKRFYQDKDAGKFRIL